MELFLFIRPSLCDQKMEVGMKIYAVSKRLDHRNDAWGDIFACGRLKIFHKCLFAAETQFREKQTIEFEEYPQHLGYGEDHLSVRCIQDEFLPHPLTPFLATLGMTRWTEAAGLAGKHKKPFRTAIRTSDPRKSTLWIAAV